MSDPVIVILEVFGIIDVCWMLIMIGWLSDDDVTFIFMFAVFVICEDIKWLSWLVFAIDTVIGLIVEVILELSEAVKSVVWTPIAWWEVFWVMNAKIRL